MSSQIDRIEGSGMPLRGDNIDTDRIIPARFLKAITFDGLGDHVFEDDRAAMADHPFSNPAYRQAKVLLANENFGSGSSREHAPQALKRWGIEACVGESFSEIFRGNSLAIGLACVTVSREAVEQLMSLVETAPDTPFSLSLQDRSLSADDLRVEIGVDNSVRDALLNGTWDATGMLLDDFDVVRGVAERVPYIRGF
ncbi:MAG: isopropylmalate isomerase [Rhodospirillaceae bacterium]|nr:isopropylmalate isomerase [Rhodospirillaceae bacterium]|tara:strand:+ start:450 stop:1040 length:591 start_codon:yes stop_codon:yes gene_type:complete